MAQTRRQRRGPQQVVAQTPRGSTLEIVAHLSVAEHAARGRTARKGVPRSAHAEWRPAADRPDPVTVIEQQNDARVPELVPIRHGRMAVSPFAFYRGAAAIMASDLATTPVSGIAAQLCGDAHLSNFGGFASPERRLVFDINDFDETLPGPWEWDVKRLAASIEVAFRENGFTAQERRDVVLGSVRQYREAMLRFAEMRMLDLWYSHIDLQALLPEIQREVGRKAAKKVGKNLAKAHCKDSLKAFSKLTQSVDGRPRIVSDPPLVVPVTELLPPDSAEQFERAIRRLLRRYRASLQNDRRVLLERFEYADLARKVVGVGSVGTRAWILLMLGRNDEDPLFLQLKEAGPSVLERHLGASPFRQHGQRVVEGQRLMQAVGDIFLGWLTTKGIDQVQRDFYVRQLWDGKASADVENMTPKGATAYGKLCAETLARAHARSGDRIAIAAYLGSGEAFDVALTDFAAAYADQNQSDYEKFSAAVESGRLLAETGV